MNAIVKLHTHHCLECARPYVCEDHLRDCWIYCQFHRPKYWKIGDFFRGFFTKALDFLDSVEGKNSVEGKKI